MRLFSSCPKCIAEIDINELDITALGDSHRETAKNIEYRLHVYSFEDLAKVFQVFEPEVTEEQLRDRFKAQMKKWLS